MGKPSKLVNFWRSYGVFFLLRNFPDFNRFLLILAQNLLTSSLFWIFLMFSESTYENEYLYQNLSKSHFSFWKYEGGANLHHPPPKIGLKRSSSVLDASKMILPKLKNSISKIFDFFNFWHVDLICSPLRVSSGCFHSWLVDKDNWVYYDN